MLCNNTKLSSHINSSYSFSYEIIVYLLSLILSSIHRITTEVDVSNGNFIFKNMCSQIIPTSSFLNSRHRTDGIISTSRLWSLIRRLSLTDESTSTSSNSGDSNNYLYY